LGQTPEPAPPAYEPEPGAVIPPPEPEPEGPKVYQVEDGTITLEKEKGQWKLTLSNDLGGSPQTYWGKTKDELLVFGMGKAQLNATKKIREQNLKLKLGTTPKPVAPQPAPAPQTRQMTADEIFEYKTLWESDPVAANDFLLKKTRGVTTDELFTLAQEGREAKANLETDGVCRIFLQRNPDYYGDENYTNFNRIIQWIGKYKAGTPVPNADAGMYKLYYAGHWTVENLEEAFADLSNDGLMVKAPKPQAPPTPPPVTVSQEPAPAPRPDERIVRTETRPRAALGIQRGDVTPVAPPEERKAPSVEDLDKLPDDEIKRLLGGVRRERIAARRS